MAFINRAKAAGFFVRVIFIATNHPSINAARVAIRVMKGGHDVPIPKIISRYSKSIANCSAIAPLMDWLDVFDNSKDNEAMRLLYTLKSGKLEKKNVAEVPEWAQNILPQQ